MDNSIEEQGKCLTSISGQQKKSDGIRAVGWDLVDLGDCGSQVSAKLLPTPPVGESDLHVNQGLSWGFLLTIQRGVNQENR